MESLKSYDVEALIPRLLHKYRTYDNYDRRDSLKGNDIFVFFSTPSGYHVDGALKVAIDLFGAEMGKSKVEMGQSYEIPVDIRRPGLMDSAVKEFIGFAKENPEKTFLLQPICSPCPGIDRRSVVEMFSPAICVDNIIMPKKFIETLLNHRMHNNVIVHTEYPDIPTLRKIWIEKLSNIVSSADYDGRVEMDCSVEEVVELIIDMCTPLLKWYYPELRYRRIKTDKSFWLRPNLIEESLAINQITEAWVECLKYSLGYSFYAPSLTRDDIVSILTYRLQLYGPYFDTYKY